MKSSLKNKPLLSLSLFLFEGNPPSLGCPLNPMKKRRTRNWSERFIGSRWEWKHPKHCRESRMAVEEAQEERPLLPLIGPADDPMAPDCPYGSSLGPWWPFCNGNVAAPDCPFASSLWPWKASQKGEKKGPWMDLWPWFVRATGATLPSSPMPLFNSGVQVPLQL